MLGAFGLALLLIGCNAPTGQTTTSGGVTLAVTPDHAQRGQTITLSGRAWHPHSKITLAFSLTSQQSDDDASLGSTTADEQGQFTFVTLVPQAAKPGTWSIIVQGDVDQSASAFFTVEDGVAMAAAISATPTPTQTPVPSATPKPTTTPPPPPTPTFAPTNTPQPVLNTEQPSVPPVLQAVWRENKLELRGNGWPVSEQVKISLSKEKNGKNAISLGVLATNDQGQFKVSVTVPKQVRDNWYVIASDDSHRAIVRITRARDD
jgi:hypothetical protein